LILGEKVCVLDRSVMMDLPPAAVNEVKDSGRADVEIFHHISMMIGAAFATVTPPSLVLKDTVSRNRHQGCGLSHHCDPP